MPRVTATSPGRSHTGPELAPTIAALPCVWQISVSGASSRMLIDHGGSIIIRSTNAPRARTPSSSPTTASIDGSLSISRQKHPDRGRHVVVHVDARLDRRFTTEQGRVDAPADDEEREMLGGNAWFGDTEQAPVV